MFSRDALDASRIEQRLAANRHPARVAWWKTSAHSTQYVFSEIEQPDNNAIRQALDDFTSVTGHLVLGMWRSVAGVWRLVVFVVRR